ncbi:FAD-dependent oxidoreductase [Nocardia transvalensis]|uniref:FAD-dependent oxidoreductase n=1 Tax=Nocardia transvalensis TaxID=37333 RepID=UPI001895EA89|nr:NAD(P)/FAD-dependent oxidoreductase [Nocardia transvalensis]MBF6332359.1 FAD-dependent monooxygenase [Nocardia transvalensis]
MMHAAVIGGGIAGATAAAALAEIGAEVEVYEATGRTTEHHGWVTLGPSAMTALDQVGVGERVRAVGFPVVEARMVNTVTGQEDRFSRYEPSHRWSSTHVWRRDLLSILRDRLDQVNVRCHFDTAVTAGEVNADLVVGADGARSETRRLLGNTTPLSFAGQVILYGHHPKPAPGLPRHVLHFWISPRGVVGYVGDDRDGSFWFSRHDADAPTDIIDRTQLLHPLRSPSVAEIVDISEMSDQIAIYELDPRGIWHNTDTVLTGDAAHAVSPATARGATSAIEDAIVLARCLRRADTITAALDTYTATRRPVAWATYRPTPGYRALLPTADDLSLDDIART